MSDLSRTEELDFHYLLTLMPPLYNVDEYAWLPELFSIIGAESLITLSKYCGGETIKIPTIEELTRGIEALQAFYDIHIKKTKSIEDIDISLVNLYRKICEVYEC